MNPLLMESLARQQTTSRRSRRSAFFVRIPPRRRPWLSRLGEGLIGLGAKLAFSRFNASLVVVRESW
jgi:hypothetical protein